jgi:hypothetical protein
MVTLSVCSTPALAAHHLEYKDFEQFVPYWTTEGSWHSELQLRNNVNGQDLIVTPSVRTADGTETRLPAVTIKPQEVKTIDISDAAPQLSKAYGSIVLRYHSAFSNSLYASLMLQDMGRPIAVHLDAIPADDTLEEVSREGVWWLPNGTTNDYLVLTNQGSRPLKLDLSLYDARGKESNQLWHWVGAKRPVIRFANWCGPQVSTAHTGALRSSPRRMQASLIPSISSSMNRPLFPPF